MRLLMIGQAPSRESEGHPPFSGKCGSFLAELMGTTKDRMLQDHDFLNVFEHWPGRGLGGDKFPIYEAKANARGLLPKIKNRTVILLGANVARAFNVKSFRYMEYYELRDPENPSQVVSPLVSIIPHPSGVNRYWNKPDNRVIAHKFFAGLLSTKP